MPVTVAVGAARAGLAVLEQRAEPGPAVRRGLGRADELVDDLREPLRVVLVREVAGVRDHLDPGARARARRRCSACRTGITWSSRPQTTHIGIASVR